MSPAAVPGSIGIGRPQEGINTTCDIAYACVTLQLFHESLYVKGILFDKHVRGREFVVGFS